METQLAMLMLLATPGAAAPPEGDTLLQAELLLAEANVLAARAELDADEARREVLRDAEELRRIGQASLAASFERGVRENPLSDAKRAALGREIQKNVRLIRLAAAARPDFAPARRSLRWLPELVAEPRPRLCR